MKSQSFTATAPAIAPVLVTVAYVGEAIDPAHPPAGDPKLLPFVAIWDTGATGTAISSKVVASCGLKPVGMVQVQTGNGIRNSEVYLISVGLPNGVGYGQVRATLADIGPDADVLVGMDIITTGDFAVTNAGGKTVLSFRCPSASTIDFVKEASPMVPAVGRNEPCPCGSKKKYKKCHGAPLGLPPIPAAQPVAPPPSPPASVPD